MKRLAMGLIAVLASAAAVQAQNDLALRTAFEGRTVTVKIDMPATSQGVEVYPQDPMPVDFRQVAQRLKDNGTALRMGQQVMITKVLIKGTSHIEFQLGGGGHGTFGDWMTSSDASYAVHAEETAEEKALKEQIRQTTDREQKKKLERELKALRTERERENARAQAEARQANEAREANLRIRRVDSGSRFNIRYRHGLPPDAITPEGIMRSLAHYIDFAGIPGAPVAGDAALNAATHDARSPTGHAGSSDGGAGLAGLRKGLTLQEVESLLGPAATAGEVQEGSLTVMKRTYVREGMNVAASFVSGVLIDFSITPQ